MNMNYRYINLGEFFPRTDYKKTFTILLSVIQNPELVSKHCRKLTNDQLLAVYEVSKSLSLANLWFPLEFCITAACKTWQILYYGYLYDYVLGDSGLAQVQKASTTGHGKEQLSSHAK